MAARDLGPRLGGAAAGARLLAGGRLRTPGAVVLAYHDVEPLDEQRTDYTVAPELLRAQLKAAARWGLTFTTLADVVDRLLGGRPVDGLAVVVFDDAFVGVHHHAAGVLADLAVPGTLFPLTTGLGSAPAWWSDAHRTMTLDETRELVAQGWEVGSHTRTHASLPDIDDRALHAEVADSRAELSEQLGVAPDLLAYPFGHHDARVREATAESGYRAGFTFLNGRIVSGLDAYRLPRLTMHQGLSVPRLAYQLARSPSSWPDHQIDEVHR